MLKTMKHKIGSKLLVITAIGLLSIMQCGAQETVKIQFDSNKEVSGKKFAIKDISSGIPTNWDSYNFVVLEFKSTTSQRFHVGFTTETGYNELRVMSYCANGWNKLAIPLKFYRELPGAALDLAATYNQARYTGWINLGGKRGPLRGVDSIGIRMNVPINNPVIEIRSIALSVEDHGDQYLGDQPVFDEFGQWNLGDYEGKIKSLDQLRKDWENEEKENPLTKTYTFKDNSTGEMITRTVTANLFNYSKYGGYLSAKVKATGFFRTEKIDGKWWFIDPEGYLFLSVGVDCVSSGGGGNAINLDKRRNMYKELPPAGIGSNPERPNSASFGTWNLFRRYGDAYPEKSKDMIIWRMEKWGLNTIANWSSPDVMKLNRKAFMLQLRGIGIEDGLMGLPDVYDPAFAPKVDASCKSFVEPNRENPWLIGYFVGNEPSWLEQESRLCSMILDGKDKPIKTELKKYLSAGDTPERRKQFIYDTFRIFLKTVDEAVKRYDPNHLNLGMRFGHVPEKEVQAICKDVFDVFSFNCYDLHPRKEFMDQIMEGTGLPMIIGEYHFGTVDRGMAQSLWQVNSQEERGVAYRYYTERAYSHPGLIGTAWFQWSDQDFSGRRDGENYNCGLVDVTDRPYQHMVEAMMETAKRLQEIHLGKEKPVEQAPVKARGHGSIPDLWEK
jgi:PKD repeat protein